jgi:hypothetical protein
MQINHFYQNSSAFSWINGIRKAYFLVGVIYQYMGCVLIKFEFGLL